MAITNTDANTRMLEGAIGRDYDLAGSINVGDAVYVNSSGAILAARANAAATSFGVGVLVALHDGDTAGVSGDRGTVCTFGPVSGYAGIVEGAPVYVSNATAGALLDAAPSGAGTWTHPIGYGERDGVLFVLPRMEAPTSNS